MTKLSEKYELVTLPDPDGNDAQYYTVDGMQIQAGTYDQVLELAVAMYKETLRLKEEAVYKMMQG